MEVRRCRFCRSSFSSSPLPWRSWSPDSSIIWLGNQQCFCTLTWVLSLLRDPTPFCFQCLLAMCRSIYILFRCMSSSRVFSFNPDSVRHFNYWLELITNFVCELIQMLSYIQLLIISPGLNLTSIFFLYHIKLTYNCMVEQLSRHRNHKKIFAHIETAYPSVKCANSDDRCVVCWELLGTSRRLPCTHHFHDWCLMWWLAQDSSCPTCRCTIPSPQEEIQQAVVGNNNNTTYRFNGGNFAFVRLPAFTIEISTSLGPLFGRPAEPTEEQLQGMLEQVREMFPQMSVDVIMADLRQSASAQATIENILEGRIGTNASQFLPGAVLDDEISDEVRHFFVSLFHLIFRAITKSNSKSRWRWSKIRMTDVSDRGPSWALKATTTWRTSRDSVPRWSRRTGGSTWRPTKLPICVPKESLNNLFPLILGTSFPVPFFLLVWKMGRRRQRMYVVLLYILYFYFRSPSVSIVIFFPLWPFCLLSPRMGMTIIKTPSL